MRTTQGHRRTPPHRARWALAAPLLLLAACGEPVTDAYPPVHWSEAPARPHPALARDLDQIRAEGTLRMIAHYNSHSYLVHKGGQAGFDYELLSRFARERELVLEVVVARPGEDLISLLNEGVGDVVCTGSPPEGAWARWVRWTRPTNFTHKVAVTGSAPPAATVADLAGRRILLPDGDPFRAELQQRLSDAGVRPHVIAYAAGTGPEALLERTRAGETDVVVVDDLVARAAQVHGPGIELGASLGRRRPAAWLVRQNSSELLAALNEFLKGHFSQAPSGRSRRSREYGIIHERYFSNRLTIRDMRAVDHRPDLSGRISPFDDEVRRQAEAAGLDWRLVVALIFQESRFDPAAVSQADARGLMQVLPRVAGAQADSLLVPAANVRAGMRLLGQAWSRYAYLDSLDRVRFTLAEYHAGFGHLNDARRLAMDLGRDPNAWDEGAARTLPLLAERRWYERTRHGFYVGRRTVAYVREIIGRYRAYMRVVPRRPQDADPAQRTSPLAALPSARPDPP